MRHMCKYRKLNRNKKRRMILLRQLTSFIAIHGRIKTTQARAEETARLVSKMMHYVKTGTPLLIARLKKFVYTEYVADKYINYWNKYFE